VLWVDAWFAAPTHSTSAVRVAYLPGLRGLRRQRAVGGAPRSRLQWRP